MGETLRLALPAPPAEVKPPAPPAEAKLPAPPAEVNTSLTSNCSTSCGAVFSAKPHKLVFVERSRLAHSRFGRGCHSSSAHWKRNSNPFSRYQLFRLPFLGEIIWVSVKRQPLFPKTPIRVAFFLRYIFVSCQKSNLNSPKCILRLPFPGNALGKAFKRATLIPQNAFYGCFFEKCRGVECVREVENKSQSASTVNAIIILKALEAVFE